MDYSLLFIKVHIATDKTPLKRMPAMVHVKNNDGSKAIVIKMIDDITEEDSG